MKMLVAFVLLAALASTQALKWKSCGKLMYSLYSTVFFVRYWIICAPLYSLFFTVFSVHHCKYSLYTVVLSILSTPLYITVFYVLQVVSSCSKVDCWAVGCLSNCIFVSNLNVVLHILNATLRASAAATQYVYKFIAPGVKMIVDCLQVAMSLTSRNWN